MQIRQIFLIFLFVALMPRGLLVAKIVQEDRVEATIYLGTKTQKGERIPQKKWENFFRDHLLDTVPGLTVAYARGYWFDDILS